MTTVATVVVECLAEANVAYVFGVPSGPWVPYMEAMRTGSIEWTTRLQASNLCQTMRRAVQVATAEIPGPVHLVTARTQADVHKALVHSLRADGPTVVQAFIDLEEYDRVILRPHKVGH